MCDDDRLSEIRNNNKSNNNFTDYRHRVVDGRELRGIGTNSQKLTNINHNFGRETDDIIGQVGEVHMPGRVGESFASQ